MAKHELYICVDSQCMGCRIDPVKTRKKREVKEKQTRIKLVLLQLKANTQPV